MPKKALYAFLGMIFVFSVAYAYWEYINKSPFSVHAWRQADCVSITQNYYAENSPFFEPKMHAQISKNGSGISEFPLFYYVSAKCWTFFGKSYVWNRLLNVLFVYIGLYFLYRLSYQIFNSITFSLLTVALFFTSPVVIYYTNNFMSNVPALMAVIIGWWFLSKYYYQQQFKYLLAAFLFFVFAALLRFTMILGFGFVYIIYVLELFNIKYFGRTKTRFFKDLIRAFIILFLAILVIISWYTYVMHYNVVHQCTYFLTTIRPIWASDKVSLIFYRLIYEHSFQLHAMPLLVFCFMVFVINIFQWRKRKAILNVVLFLNFFGVLLYLMMWFNNLYEHDYYLIDVWLFLLPNMILFIKDLLRSEFYRSYQKYLIGISYVLIGFLVLRASLYQHVKLNYNNKLFKPFYFLLPGEFLDFIHWQQWYYDTRFSDLSEVTPYLRSLGIKREDMLFSLPDNSPNISLSLMDQKGLTYFVCDPNKPLNITLKEWIQNGQCKYLLISDEEWLKKKEMEEFIQMPIGKWKSNTYIFKLL